MPSIDYGKSLEKTYLRNMFTNDLHDAISCRLMMQLNGQIHTLHVCNALQTDSCQSRLMMLSNDADHLQAVVIRLTHASPTGGDLPLQMTETAWKHFYIKL